MSFLYPETIRGRELRLFLPLYEHWDAYCRGVASKNINQDDEGYVMGAGIISGAKESLYSGIITYGIISQISPDYAGGIASMVSVGSFIANMAINPAMHGIGTVNPFNIEFPKKTKDLLEIICDKDHEPFKDIPFISDFLHN